ncbi:MAG: L-glutamate gamma-semialdehyde dehydrogenase [Caldisericia bacterium]
MKEFKNEVYTDFKNEEKRKEMEKVLLSVEKDFGKEYDIVIGGKKYKLNEKFVSINPSKKDEVIGVFQKGDEKIGEMALNTAWETFKTWKNVSQEKRAEYLFKIADTIRRKRLEFDSYLVFETGKNWLEADADVAEAIDFCDYYALESLKYGKVFDMYPYDNEKDEMVYIPLGAGVVIPPWNFPLAILTGMTTSAIVTGNTVVLKPSSDAPLIATKFMEVLEEVGLPDGVVNLVTGPGPKVGDYLVRHSKTRFISFTGSKEVGLKITEEAGKHYEGQIWIKRVVTEMGGKNAIIVEDDANIDSAVTGCIASAFGFQGQKCSALSRLLLNEKIYDEFLNKYVEKIKNIKIGPTKYYENYLGPVINETSYNKILNYIEIGKKDGKILAGGGPDENRDGYFIKPTVIELKSKESRVWKEEIFGPVVAVLKYKKFEEAVELFNDTEYGLTGAIYTKDREKINISKKELHCGNLYINRKCTGAMVGVHPFGGFNMSGTDSKAGGPDYLLLFMQAKAIGEFLGD